ncbi:hypothetical protein E1301_Tti006906 [Triplophysa tibetana]|uniref:Ig-like domain-containing protein n=1 Tax=Triplophysa tibetana TaxID=1572043 RepID=A0A5A9N437_9TELE|nr:hypothetical protein E1301_Tti006906 [Triplophysa tibetana]
MDFALVLSMSFLAAVANGHQTQVQLKPDKPFQRVQISENASIECCYSCKENTHVTWIMNIHIVNGTTKPRFVNLSDEVKAEPMTEVDGVKCHRLILKNVSVDDTALYQCFINLTSRRFSIFTHGTFLQVYTRYKDNGADEKSNISQTSLIDYLAANGIDLLTQSHIPSERLAAGALDEIISLKRLLVGSISLSDDSLAAGENEGAGPENRETDCCQSSVEESSTDEKTEGQEGGGGEIGKGEEERGISAPLVLSQERMEEVQRKLQVLEEQLKRLQSVEDYHYKLQEALGKFSLQRVLDN